MRRRMYDDDDDSVGDSGGGGGCDGDEEVGAGDGVDTSLGLRLNKLHDVHLSYPLPLMRQQLLK